MGADVAVSAGGIDVSVGTGVGGTGVLVGGGTGVLVGGSVRVGGWVIVGI